MGGGGISSFCSHPLPVINDQSLTVVIMDSEYIYGIVHNTIEIQPLFEQLYQRKPYFVTFSLFDHAATVYSLPLLHKNIWLELCQQHHQSLSSKGCN